MRQREAFRQVQADDAPARPMAGDLSLEYRPLADLVPHARNARTHSNAQVAEIAASIQAFGWTNPILVDGTNGVIAGHGRLLAARKLKLARVPVIELSGLSETDKRAYILADNRLALNAGWDEELLAAEIADLDALGFDLTLAGFAEYEIGSLVDRFLAGTAAPSPTKRRSLRSVRSPVRATSGWSASTASCAAMP